MHKELNTTLDEGQTPIVEQVCAPLTANAYADNASEESKLVPIAFSSKDHGADATRDLCPTLRAGNHADSHANGGNAPAIAFPERLSGTQCVSETELSPVLQSRNPTAVAYPDEETRRPGDGESFAFDLRGREGGAMPEGPHATANLRAGSGGSSRSYVAAQEPLPFDTTQITSAANRSKPQAGGPCHPIASQAHPPAVAFQERGRKDEPNLEYQTDLAYSLNAPNGGGRRQELNVACQEPTAYTLHGSREGTQAVASPTDTAGTIREGTGTAIQNSSTTVALSEVAQPLRSNPHNNSDPSMEATMHVLSQPTTENREPGTAWRVRRLTPEECEMLQGFPVGYTLIPGTSSKKRKSEDLSDTIDYLMSLGLPRPEAEVLAHSPDGPRYKALGNSWAVPVARWIARRIQQHVTPLGT